MASVFTKIIRREIPAYIIAEDEKHIAFLDVFPLTKGHTLVVPKTETDNIFDLSDQEFASLQLFAKKIAKGLAKAIPSKKIGLAVIGLEVPHAHIHLVPLQTAEDLNFSNPKIKLEKEEMEAICLSIQKSI